MVREKPFSFEDESARIAETWRDSQHSFLPLSVAAAITFHRAHGTTKAIATRQDFDDALNIAATALARLIPIYLSDQHRTALSIDLARQWFARGATELRSAGAPAIGHLCVKRSQALDAIAVIRRRGVPFSFTGRAISPRQNQILSALPGIEYQRVVSHMELLEMKLGATLYEPAAVLRHVFFPTSGVVSRLHVTSEGESTEIAVVGNEGLIGVAILLGGRTTLDRVVVQVAGYAYRISADALLDEFGKGGELQQRALRYVQTLMTQMAQTAVCNRHHTVEQQLCRWLLLTLDRIEGNDVIMTHELISQMLGVRRAGITEAARKLQQAGLIEASRGQITVRDRRKLEAHACECYGVVKREYDRIVSVPLITSS